jgi:hypothetical protein
MAKNKLSDLRDHLFETLERLKDEEKPMELDRAKTIADVAQTIINSAAVQVKAMNAMNADLPDFFDRERVPTLPPKEDPNLNGKKVLTNGNSVRPTTQ